MALFLLPEQNKTIKSSIPLYWTGLLWFNYCNFGKYLLAYLNYFFLAVTKSKEVEICMVKHWRLDREEKYEIVEKWFLKDLEMIDGKEADTVSVKLYIMCIENNFLIL